MQILVLCVPTCGRLISGGGWISPVSRRAAAVKREAERRARNFDLYARFWLEARHDLRPTTRVSCVCSIEPHLIPTFGSTPIDELSSEAIGNWFTGGRAEAKRDPQVLSLAELLAPAAAMPEQHRNPLRHAGIERGYRALNFADGVVVDLGPLVVAPH